MQRGGWLEDCSLTVIGNTGTVEYMLLLMPVLPGVVFCSIYTASFRHSILDVDEPLCDLGLPCLLCVFLILLGRSHLASIFSFCGTFLGGAHHVLCEECDCSSPHFVCQKIYRDVRVFATMMSMCWCWVPGTAGSSNRQWGLGFFYIIRWHFLVLPWWRETWWYEKKEQKRRKKNGACELRQQAS